MIELAYVIVSLLLIACAIHCWRQGSTSDELVNADIRPLSDGICSAFPREALWSNLNSD